MSVSLEGDEDTELRDAVSDVLQSCGILGRIKAELRSNVYLALEGGECNLRRTNQDLSEFIGHSEGRLVVNLVREFLTFFQLNHTLSIFEPEVIEGRSCNVASRQELMERLGWQETLSGIRSKKPLLSEVIRLSKVSILDSETSSPTRCSEGSVSLSSMPPRENSQKSSSYVAPPSKGDPCSSTVSPQNLTPELGLPPSMEPPHVQSSKAVGTLPPLSSNYTAATSLLGDLPPLNGSVAGGKNVLAPLKNGNLVGFSKDTHNTGMESWVGERRGEQRLFDDSGGCVQSKSAGKDIFSKKIDAKKIPDPILSPGDLDVDETIEEELDDFLLNSGQSASEELTKDESASAGTSLQADYEEK